VSTGQVNPVVFREYDIRGVAGLDLTEETVGLVARALGTRVRAAGGRTVVLATKGRPVAVIGMDDVVVVDAGDAILVCRKDRAQDVRKAVDELSRRGRDEVL